MNRHSRGSGNPVFRSSAEALFRLTATHFLLLVQEKGKQREAHPGASPLRFATGCPAVLAARGGCGTRPGSTQSSQDSDSPRRNPLVRLRSSATLKGPQNRIRQKPTEGSCASVPLFRSGWMRAGGVDLRFPFVDAEKRSGLRGSRRGLSEPRAKRRRRVPVARTAEQVPGAQRLDATRERDIGAPSAARLDAPARSHPRCAGPLLCASAHPPQVASIAGKSRRSAPGPSEQGPLLLGTFLGGSRKVPRRQAKRIQNNVKLDSRFRGNDGSWGGG